MVDSVLVQHGLAHEFWRGTNIDNLPPFHAGVVSKIVEQPEGVVQEGWVWDGTSFSPPPDPDPVADISTLLIAERLTDGEIDFFINMRTGDADPVVFPQGQQRRFMFKYDAADFVTVGDELADGIETAFGATRTAEILAAP